MKKIISFLLMLLALASCSDQLNENGSSTSSDIGGLEGGGITLTISLPDFSKEELTRAGDTGLTSLNAVAYDKDGKFLYNESVTDWDIVENGYKVKVPVADNAAMIHLVANAGSLTDEQCQNGLDKAAFNGPISMENPLCWGRISVSALMETNPSITLLRQFGKVSVQGPTTNSSSEFIEKEAFTVEGYKLYKAAGSGTIAPTEGNWNASTWEVTAPTLPSGVSYNNTSGEFTTGDIAFYESETKAGQAFLIIKGKYKGVTGYYKVAFYGGKKGETFVNLLRNHAYTVKISYVNINGWKTEEEAVKDPYPENRMRVDVKDDNPLVNDMIACKDYHLGVSDQVSGTWDGGTIGATIVTTIKDEEKPAVTYSDSWITGIDWGETINVPEAGGSNSTPGKKYHINIKVDNNAYQEEPRKGTVTVKSGDLECTIIVTQGGKDFKRSDRTVKLVTSNTTLGTEEEYNDYFNKFLTKTKGIKPADMQGIVRNDGLHFSVTNNTFSYLIPKKPGDSVKKGINGEKFNVIEDGNYWKVTLNSSDFDIWKGDFTITYSDKGHDISIKYPVYHCGIFHAIAADDPYQMMYFDANGNSRPKVSGRFYYGVVKIKGNSGKTYIMLDRNLGASNDGYYTPSTKALEGNIGAIGGYFLIGKTTVGTDKKKNIVNYSDNVSPAGFTIPTNDNFQDIIDGGRLKVVTKSTASGETYNCVEIETFDSELQPIYLPATGYMEGENFKNPTHVELWTRTLLSGNQGFASDSPEYGFWYRYFDVYGKIITMSNLRFVSGSNALNTGIYIAMPIRLVHVLQ